ncbi:SMP-30/gluconolactonase/LRE family protein [Phenylobacterium sp. J426]|uniref:SMP-30/gluconolactonase/LRE family protein n=1 Tax=Phenylobacterium sp. J426 TaxID=2898439 RepID=UPI002151BCF5|nr:SMP-30/gluconolactonase/LRE family protein [Phenylobacterium sp. J426]MCR5876129.1 SMP-30/gluconolactonase/LRE family protein [Phenylobacterium sp. J426]
MEVRCVVNAADRLGEGPLWSAAERRLYWFDIKHPRLAWFEPATGDSGTFDLPMRASAAVPRAAGGLLMATEKGLAIVDPQAGTIAVTQPYELGAGFRTNDGKVDMQGRFWWSTMDDDGGKRPGSVFRTDRDGKTTRVLTGIHIPNTVSFSPDGSVLYMADSKLQTLFAHQTADLSQVREFAHTRGTNASPDGSAVDAEGHLWNAQWGGWRIVRYAPDGRVDRVVQVPVEQPTSCAFGGPDLGTLYITSAWDELSDEARAKQPLAGGLFAVDTLTAWGVKGLPLPVYEG